MWIHVWLPSREHYFFHCFLLFLLFIIPAMPLYRACLLTCLPRSVSGSNTGTRLCSVSAFVTLIVPPRRFFFSWLIPDCSVDRCWQQTSPPVAGDDVLLRRLRLLLLSLWFSFSALKRRLSSEPNLHYICRGRPLWRVYLFILLLLFFFRCSRVLRQAQAPPVTGLCLLHHSGWPPWAAGCWQIAVGWQLSTTNLCCGPFSPPRVLCHSVIERNRW